MEQYLTPESYVYVMPSTLFLGDGRRSRLGLRMPISAEQLHKLDAGDEHVHREKAVVLRYNDQRIAGPDHACGEQRSRLRHGQRFSRAAQVAKAGNDEALLFW